MLVKITINKQTLECTTDDNTIVINHIIDNDTELEIEISKSEPEAEYPWQQ
jgi:hypothetical protein